MSTLDATVSLLKTMSEEDRVLVLKFTHDLCDSQKACRPDKSVDQSQIFADLEESRRQIRNGQGVEMKKALSELGVEHGFL